MESTDGTESGNYRACSTNSDNNLIEYAALAPPVESTDGTESGNHRACSTNSDDNLIEYAALAQLVEQGTENPCVLGSIPRRGIFFISNEQTFIRGPWFPLAKTIHWIVFARQSETRHHLKKTHRVRCVFFVSFFLK